MNGTQYTGIASLVFHQPYTGARYTALIQLEALVWWTTWKK